MKLHSKYFLPIFFLIYFLIWYVVSFGLNIHPDSLEYWIWSQNISLGYANNSPMIAYGIKIMNLLIKNNIWAIKIGAIINSGLVLMAAYWSARGFLSQKESRLYLLILGGTIYYSLSTQFWSIEQPYNFFWFLTLGSLARYINTKRVRWLFGMGVFFALGVLSKYIIGLFVIILLCWILWNKEHRYLLWNPYLWLSGLLVITILVPHLYWNYQRDWVTFIFLFHKGLKQGIFWNNLWQIQVSHLFFYSIFFSLPSWWVLIKHKQFNFFASSKFSLILIHSIIPVVFFSYSSLTGKIADPNWMAASYISVFLLLAKYCYHLIQQGKKYFVILSFSFSYITLVSLTIFILLFQHYQFSFVPKTIAGRLNEANGWKEFALSVEKVFQEKNKKLPQYLITKHFHTGAAVSFYLTGQPTNYVTQRDEREFVDKKTIAQNRAIILIRSQFPEDVAKIQKIFPQKWTYMGEIAAIFRGKKLRAFQVWLKD